MINERCKMINVPTMMAFIVSFYHYVLGNMFKYLNYSIN